MKQSILFVDQFGEVTGGQIVLQSLVRVTREAGYEVGVLAPRGGGLEAALRASWGETIALHDLRELSLQSGRKGWRDVLRLLAYTFYLLRFLRLISSYDVVYINGGRLALPFALLSLLAPRSRWIYHLHLCHSGLEKRLLGLIARLPSTGKVVLASRFILEDFASQQPHFTHNPKVCVIENCLNAPFDELPFADRLLTSDAKLTVALIGRVSPVKGHDLLPALARVLPKLSFVFIGRTSEDQQDFLRSILDQAPPNLRYVGESTNLPELIAELSVNVSIVPSRWEEPFGLVSIESMALSCFTLVSHRGMLPYIAEATGAWCFHDDTELTAMLERMQTMSRVDLQKIAARQYTETLRQFGFNDFRQKILQVLAPNAAAGTGCETDSPNVGTHVVDSAPQLVS